MNTMHQCPNHTPPEFWGTTGKFGISCSNCGLPIKSTPSTPYSSHLIKWEIVDQKTSGKTTEEQIAVASSDLSAVLQRQPIVLLNHATPDDQKVSKRMNSSAAWSIFY